MENIDLDDLLAEINKPSTQKKKDKVSNTFITSAQEKCSRSEFK